MAKQYSQENDVKVEFINVKAQMKLHIDDDDQNGEHYHDNLGLYLQYLHQR